MLDLSAHWEHITPRLLITVLVMSACLVITVRWDQIRVLSVLLAHSVTHTDWRISPSVSSVLVDITVKNKVSVAKYIWYGIHLDNIITKEPKSLRHIP